MSNQPPSLPPTVPAPPTSSLVARLFNVLAAPGEVFDEVRASACHHGNWLAPVLLCCVAGIVSVFFIYAQPTILQQVRVQQERAIEQKLRQMTPAQREQVKASLDQFTSPTLIKAFAAAGALFAPFGQMFATALVMWLIAKLLFQVEIPFLKVVEVAGLTWMIALVGQIVGALLIVGKGNLFATPGPVLLVGEIDPGNRTHILLSSCNVITLWQIAALAAGLARLSDRGFFKIFPCLFLPWALFKGGFTLLGLGLAAKPV